MNAHLKDRSLAGRGAGGALATSSGTPSPSMPELHAVSPWNLCCLRFFCCLCTSTVGKPLDLQNKPRLGHVGLCHGEPSALAGAEVPLQPDCMSFSFISLNTPEQEQP